MGKDTRAFTEGGSKDQKEMKGRVRSKNGKKGKNAP